MLLFCDAERARHRTLANLSQAAAPGGAVPAASAAAARAAVAAAASAAAGTAAAGLGQPLHAQTIAFVREVR